MKAAEWPAEGKTLGMGGIKGDLVEVHGLQSESGQALNGTTGIVSCFDSTSGRYQVEFDGHGLRAFKPENLQLVGIAQEPVQPVGRAAACLPVESFSPGDRVEVQGLQSDAGQAMNGSTGVVSYFDSSKGRYQVDVDGHGCRAFKPDNLRRLPFMEASTAPEAALDTLSLALEPSVDEDRRFQALCSIKEAGLPANRLEEHVARCLQDTNWRIRGAAVEALGSIGCAGAHGEILEGLLRQDAHGDVRFAAAEVLGRAAGSHVEALAGALGDADEGVQMAAAVALGKAGAEAAAHAGALASLLNSNCLRLRLAGANSLARLGNAAAPYLHRLVVLCEGDESKEVRLAAALAVVQAGEAADPYEERISKVLEQLT